MYFFDLFFATVLCDDRSFLGSYTSNRHRQGRLHHPKDGILSARRDIRAMIPASELQLGLSAVVDFIVNEQLEPAVGTEASHQIIQPPTLLFLAWAAILEHVFGPTAGNRKFWDIVNFGDC